MSNISLSLSNFLFIFSCFMFNCLNEENKEFTNNLSLFLLIFSCSYHISHIYIYIKAEFWCRDYLEFRHLSMFFNTNIWKCMFKYLFNETIKIYICFICNALNFLNEENKRFSNCLFLSLYLIFFSFMFNYLNEEKQKVHKLSHSLFFF